MCFFEQLGTSVGGTAIGKIVSEESASLRGYPSVSLHADHIGMCKFDDDKDGEYQRVANVLERWAGELKEEIKREDAASSPKIKNNATFGDINKGNQFGMYKSSGPTKSGSGGTWNMGSPRIVLIETEASIWARVEECLETEQSTFFQRAPALPTS